MEKYSQVLQARDDNIIWQAVLNLLGPTQNFVPCS